MNRATFLRLLLLAPLGGRQASAAAISNDISLDYLLRRQSADGAWRSTTYGAFRDGRALTPHVLRCLSRFDDPDLASAKEKAVTWLIARKSDLFEAFPVHLASAVWESATRIDSLELLCVPAVEKLLSLQTSSGAWSYSPVPLRRAVIPSAMQQPNLSLPPLPSMASAPRALMKTPSPGLFLSFEPAKTITPETRTSTMVASSRCPSTPLVTRPGRRVSIA